MAEKEKRSKNKEAEEAAKKDLSDMEVIPNYNAKLNMLDPDSRMSKLVGILIIAGIILYFFNQVIPGILLTLAGVILYVILRIILKKKDKKK